MAFSAREVIMTFRGQNYLSSALRRVGQDVGGLSRAQQLGNAARQAEIGRQRLQTQLQIRQQEEYSVTSGQRYLAAQTALTNKQQQQVTIGNRLEAQQTRLSELALRREMQEGKIATIETQIQNNPLAIARERELLQIEMERYRTGDKRLQLDRLSRSIDDQDTTIKMRNNAIMSQLVAKEGQIVRLQEEYNRLSQLNPNLANDAQLAAARRRMAEIQNVGIPQAEVEAANLRAQQVIVPAQMRTKQDQDLERLIGLEDAQQGKLAELQARYDKLGTTGDIALKKLQDDLVYLNKQLALTESREADLQRTIDGTNVAYNNQAVSIQHAQERLAGLQARQAQLRDEIATTNVALKLQAEREAQLAMQMRALPWERFQAGARTVENAGRAIQMFGLIGTATFGYLAKSAADFNTQATLAATQAVLPGHNAVANVRRIGNILQQQLTGLLASGQTTAKPDELTNAAYRVFSSITLPGNQQQQIKEGIGLIKNFNQVLTANYGMVSFDEVTRAGIMILNNFDKNLKNVHGDLNTLQAAVRYGNVNMSDFIGMLNQAAPAGKAAGYSFGEVASSLAFLSRTLSPRIASAGYARLTETLIKNATAFRQQGIEVEKAGGGLRPLNQIVSEILSKFPKLATGQMSVVTFLEKITGSQSTVQARRALTQYLHDLSGAQHITNQIINDNNELARSAVAAGTSPGVAWAKFTNQLRGLILLIGQGAIPAFAALGRPIEKFLKWFADLSPHTQRLIGYIGALTAALALLGGTGLWLVGALAALLVNMRLIAGFAKEGGGIGGLFGFAARDATAAKAAVGELASSEAGFIRMGTALKLGGIGLAITGLIMFHKQVGEVVNALGGLRNAIGLVTVAFAAWKLISYISTFAQIVRGTALLATSISEVGTAAKIATLETVGLRGALLGIAGLVVTAVILIKEDKVATNAIRTAFGDTLQKQIDAVTATPRKQSFWQKFGEWFTRPSLFRGRVGGAGAASGIAGTDPLGWSWATNQANTEMGRMSLAYRSFLSLLGRKQGSPHALDEFARLFKQAGLSAKSSIPDIQRWLRSFGAAAEGTQLIHNLDNQLKAVARTQFELAHQYLYHTGDTGYERQQMKNAIAAKAAAEAAKSSDTTIAKSAVQQGVVATKTYQQLYIALVKAHEAMLMDQTSIPKQRAYIDALGALQSNVSKQQAQAAERAASAATKVAPAWQAATQQGILATATYTRLYDAVNAAQAALNRDPTLANQRQFLAAQRALDNYVQNATQANQQLATSTKTTFQDVVNSVTSMYQQLLQQNQQNFGTLFQGPFTQSPQMQNFAQWGGKLTGQDLTRDLQSQIGQFRRFNRLLIDLQRRGAPQELINQLRAMGPQAIQQIRALTQMSGPELKKYFGLFQEGQRAIHQQTMRDLNTQLKDYLKYGRNIALQMVAGIRQESPQITKAIESAVRRAFGRFGGAGGVGTGGGNESTRTGTTHHHTHTHHHRHTQMQHDLPSVGVTGRAPTAVRERPPKLQNVAVQGLDSRTIFKTFETKKFQDVQGRVHVTNPVNHVHSTIDSPRQPWKVRLDHPIVILERHHRRQDTSREIHQHDHYHVTAPTNSNIDTQIRHAAFRNRNRHKTRPGINSDRYNV